MNQWLQVMAAAVHEVFTAAVQRQQLLHAIASYGMFNYGMLCYGM